MANSNLIINNTVDLKKLKGMTYGALNTHSLFIHIEEVQLLLQRSELHILMQEETFLNYSVDNDIPGINKYNLFRMDRDGRHPCKGHEVGCLWLLLKPKQELTSDMKCLCVISLKYNGAMRQECRLSFTKILNRHILYACAAAWFSFLVTIQLDRM